MSTCRIGCAACCIVISISSPLPGMPDGKPAGVRCVNLSPANACLIHGTSVYPAICRSFKSTPEMCGETDEHAFAWIANAERLTEP